jgi:L-iditol 2-dehydrogenase
MTTNNVPGTTRAAFYEAGGRVSVREVELPQLRTGELLVRVNACGLCASEVLPWYADSKAPFWLGHEPVAEILATGEGAAPANGGKPFTAGERVFVHHHAPCMICRRCKRGDFVQCATWRATRLTPGALSQLVVVPVESVRHDTLRIPETLSDEAATLVEPLATVVKAMRRSGLHSGDSVLVIGLGAMGMMHMLVARERGAGLVLGADRVPSRLREAAHFGAGLAIDVAAGPLADQVRAATDGEGADIVFVTPASPEALAAGASCLAPGGCLIVFTPLGPNEPWQLNVNDLFFKDARIVMTYSAGPDDTREALQLLSNGLAVEGLFTHRFGLDQAAAAYAMLKQPETALKVLVYPQRSTV